MSVTKLLDADDVSRTIARIAHQVIEKTAVDSPDAPTVVLLGIPSGESRLHAASRARFQSSRG